ncbi:RHS repeat domain-containing protein, partial [Tahibacter harae]|nr:RHS repeat protein [Tahibacter harae]
MAQTDIAVPLSGIPARTTRYVYDAESRLIGVVLPNPQTGENPVGIADALGRGEYPAATIASSGVLVTRYGYDEQGNKISQTDALNRTTTWAYDKAGRVIRRTLPL